jgi:2-iminobutanoate/2-iminopropanoate deaminase
MKDVVEVSPALLEINHFSNARVVGDMVYLAGHTAIDDDGKVVFPGDPIAQFRYSMEGMAKTLEAVGSSLSKLVQITIYMTDTRYRPALRDVRMQIFSKPPYPASTLVGVTSLAFEGLCVEIEGIAQR